MIARCEPVLSVIIPVYHESAGLALLFRRLYPVLEALHLPFEVIAVDDGSTDDSLSVLQAELKSRHDLRVLALARNFGQHAAVLAGFGAARGEWLISMDADLQNPPEEIRKVVDALRRGHDVVHTARRSREDNLFRRVASRVNCSLARRLSGVELVDFGCMLRGYHRSIMEPILRRQEFRGYLPLLGSLYARHPVEITVEHSARAAGKSKYSLRDLLRLQLDLLTTFSLAPLRLLFVVGGVIGIMSVLLGIVLLGLRIFYGAHWAGEGVFTLFALLFFMVGAQFCAFGLLGEYVGRICLEVRQRPAYILREAFPPLQAAKGSRGDEAAVRTGCGTELRPSEGEPETSAAPAQLALQDGRPMAR
jgi:undecaprenyl-phosphate 4-deoxy-4-formamido-L-arabinose transferase